MSAADKYGPPRANQKAVEQVKQAGQAMKEQGVTGGKDAAQPTGPAPTPSVADKYGSPKAHGRDITQEKGRQGPQRER